MRIRVTFEAKVEEDGLFVEDRVNVPLLLGMVRRTVTDGLVNFVQVRTGGGTQTVREVVEEEMRRKVWLSEEQVEAKVRDRTTRCVLAEALRIGTTTLDVTVLHVGRVCLACREDVDECRCYQSG
jgi:hypothetical protein